jgi:hypothetical protein
MHIADVFENMMRDPTSYTFDPEQMRQFHRVVAFMDSARRLKQKYGVAPGDDLHTNVNWAITDIDEPYFPRGIVVQAPPGASRYQQARPAHGRRIGARPGFGHPRIFETEEEGWANGYIYSDSIQRRLISHAEDLYRAIAAKRLALDPAIGVRSAADVEQDLRLQYAAHLASGSMTQGGFDMKLANELLRRTVPHPAFIGSYMEPETAERIKKAFPQTQSSLRRNLSLYNNAARMVRLGYDISPLLVQGLPTLFTRPDIWARAAGNGFLAFRDPDTFARMVQNNPDLEAAARLYVTAGGTLGRLQEFTIGSGEGEILPSLAMMGARAAKQRLGAAGGKVVAPALRGFARTTEAFGHFHSTLMDFIKLQTFRAMLSPNMPRESIPDLVRRVENMAMQGRMEQAGVGQSWALTERSLLLSAGYYRAGASFIADAMDDFLEVATKGRGAPPEAKAFTKRVAIMASAALATYFLAGLKAGMRKDELIERLNPADKNFGNLDITTPTGRKKVVSYGGLLKSYIRLIAEMVTVDDPKKLTKANKDNPIFKWFWGHASPAVGTTISAIKTEDYVGKDFGGSRLITDNMPMFVSNIIESEGPAVERGLELAMEATGINIWPQSYTKQHLDLLDDYAHRVYGAPYDELSVQHMIRTAQGISGELAKVDQSRRELSPSEEGRMRERMHQARILRQERITAGLRKDTKRGLDMLGLRPSAFDSEVRIPRPNRSAAVIRLTEMQSEELEKMLTEEYQHQIDKNSNRLFDLLSMTEQSRKERMLELWSGISARAKRVALLRWQAVQNARARPGN